MVAGVSPAKSDWAVVAGVSPAVLRYPQPARLPLQKTEGNHLPAMRASSASPAIQYL